VPRIALEPLRGFRDILEPESRMLTYLGNIFREIVEAHGYEEVKPPTLERFELFALKSGEEIRRSMYVFRDKAGREVALRPEATASIARIYLKHLRGRQKPIRLYYIVNCFRYEEPQRARYREFWQAGIEILGEQSILADFEAIKILTNFYRRIGMLDNIVLKLGSTRLYRILFAKHGVPEEIQDHILHLMDKNMYEAAINELMEKGYQALAVTLKEIWSNKDSLDKAKQIVAATAPEAQEAITELEELKKSIEEYEPTLKLEVDLSFARGLAYYTGVIYEVKVPGFPVSIAGGGRYDDLIKVYGDEDVPGTGFAIGLDRTLAAIQEVGKTENILPTKRQAAIIMLGEKHAQYAARTQDALIEKGLVAKTIPASRLQKALTRVVKQGYDYAVIIGDREANEGKVTVRDLRRRKQATVTLHELRKAESIDNIFLQ